MELKGVRVFIHTQANPHCLPLLFMGPATIFPHSPLSHQLHARPVLHDWELPGKPFWLLVKRGNPVMTTTRRGSYNSDTSSFSCVRSFLCVQPTDHVLTSHEHSSTANHSSLSSPIIWRKLYLPLLRKRDNRPKMKSLVLSPYHQTKT